MSLGGCKSAMTLLVMCFTHRKAIEGSKIFRYPKSIRPLEYVKII